jgi:hypothetical protein
MAAFRTTCEEPKAHKAMVTRTRLKITRKAKKMTGRNTLVRDFMSIVHHYHQNIN